MVQQTEGLDFIRHIEIQRDISDDYKLGQELLPIGNGKYFPTGQTAVYEVIATRVPINEIPKALGSDEDSHIYIAANSPHMEVFAQLDEAETIAKVGKVENDQYELENTILPSYRG